MIKGGITTERFEKIRYYIKNFNSKSTSTCSLDLILSKTIQLTQNFLYRLQIPFLTYNVPVLDVPGEGAWPHAPPPPHTTKHATGYNL